MTDNLRGILAVLIGSTAFAFNDAIVKLVSAELPSGEIIVIRGAIATVMLATVSIAIGAVRPLSSLMTPIMLLRIVSAAAATTCIVLSLRYMPLPTVTTAMQVTPLAVTAGAAIVFGEKVGWRRWLATLAGFLGVVLIVKPGTQAFGAAAYLALTALLFTTMRDLATRGLDRDMPSIFVAAATAAAITLSGFVVAPFDAPWTVPSWWALGWLTVCGVCLFVANIFMVVALRTGEIAVVAPFRYAPVPLTVWLGYWWWGDVLDSTAFLGIGLVVAAGLYTLHRERSTLRNRAQGVAKRSPAQ
ncbi:MAG: DMT family transporter [Hyphomonadaceae bacterium]|nr:DMT family transporter [Hyphomonadaceae bacterium]